MNYFYSYTDTILQAIGLRQKPFFIPNQSFSLPTPILQHILSNTFISSQLKLFKSCKLFRNYFRKFPGLQVHHLKFYKIRQVGNDYEIDGNSLSIDENFFYENLKLFTASRPKRLTYCDDAIYSGDEIDNFFVNEIIQTFNYSILENVYLRLQAINKEIVMSFLVPSLICLKLFFPNGVNEDILGIVLSNAPNLKKLFIDWQEDTNSLKNAMKIQRKTKLYISYFFGIRVYPPAVDVVNYILQHMENDGRLKFAWRKNTHTSESALVEYKNEILQLLQLKSGTNNYNEFSILLP